uniref:Thyroglobulin type-1 domain-containing protein n=1 Tax=Rhabditophanes sp. KR3021 TaxID=114890 RepID=A0AC35TRF4_9BILA
MKFHLFALLAFLPLTTSKRICELQNTCRNCDNFNRFSYYPCKQDSDCFHGEICQAKFCCPNAETITSTEAPAKTSISTSDSVDESINFTIPADSAQKKEIPKSSIPNSQSDSKSETKSKAQSDSKCPDGSSWLRLSCKQKRRQTLHELANTDIYGVYIPKCVDDGALYRAKQCKAGVNECWCVNGYGKKVEGIRSYFDDVLNCDSIPRPAIVYNSSRIQSVRRSPQRHDVYRGFVAECGFNEHFVPCLSNCQPNCMSPLEQDCITGNDCIPGCHCMPGFIRTNELPNSPCVQANQCFSSMMGQSPSQESILNNAPQPFQFSPFASQKCQDPRREFHVCGSTCPISCANRMTSCNSNRCAQGCFCKVPYIVENGVDPTNSKCILPSQCPLLSQGQQQISIPPRQTNNPQQQPSITSIPGRVLNGQCADPLKNFQFQQYNGQNIPHSPASLEFCARDPRRVWTSCGGSLRCNPSCTTEQSQGQPGCTCKQPFVLLDHTDPLSSCISREFCPAATPPPTPFSPSDSVLIGPLGGRLSTRCADPLKEYRVCATSCPMGCNNLSPKDCAPCVAGCFCKNGFIFEDAVNWQISKCVTMDTCPSFKLHIGNSQCNDPFAEFKECGSQCPEYCGQPQKPICSPSCYASCQCKPGYIRAQNYHSAPCVSVAACTSLSSFLANEDKDNKTTLNDNGGIENFIKSPSAFADLKVAKVLVSSTKTDKATEIHVQSVLSQMLASRFENSTDTLLLAVHKYGDISSNCSRIGEVLVIREVPIILDAINLNSSLTQKTILWDEPIDVLSFVGRAVALHNITALNLSPPTMAGSAYMATLGQDIPISCAVIGLSDQTTFN